jgi:hypothetical protein
MKVFGITFMPKKKKKRIDKIIYFCCCHNSKPFPISISSNSSSLQTLSAFWAEPPDKLADAL